MPAVHLTHQSPGAPQMGHNVSGDLTKVIKWCLLQAGWTLAFEDANETAVAIKQTYGMFENYIQFDNTSDARTMSTKLFSSMSALNTGTDETTPTMLTMQYDADGNYPQKPWVFYGDEKSFVFGMPPQTPFGTYSYFYVAGGLLQTENAAENSFFVVGTDNTTSATGWGWLGRGVSMPTYLSANNSVRFLYNKTGTVTNRGGTPYLTHIGSHTTSGMYVGHNGDYIDSTTGDIFLCPGYLGDQDKVVRGYIRGLYYPCGNWLDDSGYADGDVIVGAPTPSGPRDLVYRHAHAVPYVASPSYVSVLLLDEDVAGWPA